ncbi:amidase [Desulfovibrio porci]|uniref:amidase n=1 Tax=Desulfovibrio porci TaxID=2605782 RepID=UPI002A83EA14|nr:amidase [Desulfovibrio porci]MDY3810388.1 amidase [Desulfovibrio porci]
MTTAMKRRDFLRLSAIAAIEAGLLTFGLSRPALASPAEKEGLAYLTALEQIQYYREGKLSPVDVLTAQIQRIRKYNGPLNTSGEALKDHMKFNGQVNAITYEHFDQAMKAAKESEKRYKTGSARVLEGVTVAIKDENDVRGWRVTMGSIALKDAPPSKENAAIIDMLLSAGAVLHIQTTVPEFYIHGQTWSRLWGVTRNPWNLYYAAGGSSGGSGAALAAGFTTLATGSDMGGSIRIPASLCGLYGFKAPFGRVPTSETTFETLGPLARTFGDMALMQNVISGPHPKVHAALRPKLDYPQNYKNLKGVKIALDYFGGWIKEGIDVSVRDSLNRAADVLRGQGAVVDEVRLGWSYARIYQIFMNGLLSTGIGAMMLNGEKYQDIMTSYARYALKSARNGGPAAMDAADELATRLHRQLQEEVYGKGYHALIMPTLATPYFPADNDPTTDTVTVNGKPVKGMEHALTYIWNLLSRYPVVDVPVGIAPNNIPMGMQVVGNTFDDLAAFRVASGYSRAGLRLYSGRLFPDYRDKA